MTHRLLLAAVLTTMLVSTGAYAQQPTLKESKPGLTSKAKVTAQDAQKTALNTWKGASVSSEMIEERGNRLVYVFKLASGKHSRMVTVDANTGAVVKPRAHAARSKKH